LIVLEEITPAKTIGDESPDPASLFLQQPPDTSWQVSPESVEQMIQEITPMHQKYLLDETLANEKWIFCADSAKGIFGHDLKMIIHFMRDAWSKTYAKSLAGEYEGTPWKKSFVVAMEQVLEQCDELFATDLELSLPVTLCHGDYHTSNVLRKIVPEGKRVRDLTVIDFQCVAINEPVSDIGYLIGLGLNRDSRTQHAERLVRLSWSALDPILRARNENRITFEVYWLRYKVQATFKLMVLAMFIESLMSDGRGDAYLPVYLVTRIEELIEDYGDPIANWRESHNMLRNASAT